MEKAQHTLGGWQRNIKPASKYPTIFAGQNTHVAQVCTIGLSHDEIEANIDLIVAAPELLEALGAISTECERRGIHYNEIGEMAKAAIAKAGGK